MKEKIIRLIKSETGLYLILGFLTTAVNYISFWIALQHLGYERILTVNTVSFVCAVIFAYITNKIFVFNSTSRQAAVLFKEMLSFLSARLLSYFFEQAGLYLCTDILKLEKILGFRHKRRFNCKSRFIVFGCSFKPGSKQIFHF